MNGAEHIFLPCESSSNFPWYIAFSPPVAIVQKSIRFAFFRIVMGSQPSHGSFVGHNPQQQAPAPTASNASLGNLKSMADVEAGVSSGANGKRRNWKVISFLRSLSAKLSRSLKIDSTPEKKVRKSITRSGCAIGILSVLLSGVLVTVSLSLGNLPTDLLVVSSLSLSARSLVTAPTRSMALR